MLTSFYVLNDLQHRHGPLIIQAMSPVFPQKICLNQRDWITDRGSSKDLNNEIIFAKCLSGDKMKLVVVTLLKFLLYLLDWWGNIKQFLIRNGSFNCLTWPWKFERVISKHSKCCSSLVSPVSTDHHCVQWLVLIQHWWFLWKVW